MKLIAIVLFTALSSYAEQGNETYYRQFQSVFDKVVKEYVKEPDKQKITDAALGGLLSSLDPHSFYLVDDELDEFVNDTKGEFGGVGIEILYEGGVIKIITPIDDLPADRAGIKAGDYIIDINDKPVADLGFYKAVKNMRGKPGTKVKLKIFRKGEKQTKEYELTRQIVKLNSVKFHLNGNIGYVRISAFNENTTDELKSAFKNLLLESKNGMLGVILDLRNNPGGLLDQAISVSEYFIDYGTVVSTKGRTKSSNSKFSAKIFTAKAPKIPMVVMINGASASASEIVAGCLQDHERAIILGTKSFGKASVQTLTHINKRSGVKLTTASYYTPKGRLIQGEGIIPDVIVNQAKVDYIETTDSKKITAKIIKDQLEEQEDKENKEADQSLETKDIKGKKKITPDEIDKLYRNDYQYARSVDLLRGLNLINKKDKGGKEEVKDQ